MTNDEVKIKNILQNYLRNNNKIKCFICGKSEFEVTQQYKLPGHGEGREDMYMPLFAAICQHCAVITLFPYKLIEDELTDK